MREKEHKNRKWETKEGRKGWRGREELMKESDRGRRVEKVEMMEKRKGQRKRSRRVRE